MSGKTELYAWADRAARHVRFLPDRAGVRAELQNHMEDRYEALTAGGLDEGAAAARTVAAMGDADQVGRALNRLHSPLLGWAWLLSKVLVILLAAGLALAAVLIVPFDAVLDDQEIRRAAWAFEETDYQYRKRLLLAEGNGEAVCGDYTLRLPAAARWRWEGEETDFIYLRLESEHALFTPELDMRSVYSALRITDDQGRRWAAANMGWCDTMWDPCSEFGWISFRVPRDSATARWYEVSYDRGGHRFTLRIDMEEAGA